MTDLEKERLRRHRHCENQRRWLAKNRDKAREAQRRWRENNREKVRENQRRYRQKNRQRILEAQRRWKERNAESYRASQREYQRAWRAANPDRLAVYAARERQRAANRSRAEPDSAPIERLRAKLQQNEIYAAVWNALPNYGITMKEELATDAIIEVLETGASIPDAIRAGRRRYRRDHRSVATISLDAPLPSGKGTLHDLIGAKP